MCERLFKDDNQIKYQSYCNIGLVYRNMGDLKSSQEYYIKASEMYERLFQEDNQTKIDK